MEDIGWSCKVGKWRSKIYLCRWCSLRTSTCFFLPDLCTSEPHLVEWLGFWIVEEGCLYWVMYAMHIQALANSFPTCHKTASSGGVQMRVQLGWMGGCLFVCYHVLSCFLFQFASLVAFQTDNKLTQKPTMLPQLIFSLLLSFTKPGRHCISHTECHNLVVTHASLEMTSLQIQDTTGYRVSHPCCHSQKPRMYLSHNILVCNRNRAAGRYTTTSLDSWNMCRKEAFMFLFEQRLALSVTP